MREDVTGSEFDRQGDLLAESEQGRHVYNLKDALASFVVGSIDEVEKGGGGAIQKLFNLLAEREVRNGDQIDKAKTETVFFAGNATLHEMLDTIRTTSGNPTTGPAALNRMQLKAYVHNWLSVDEHIGLLKRRLEMRMLQAQRERGQAGVETHHRFVPASKIDYPKLRLPLREVGLFVPNDGLIAGYAQLVESLKGKNNRARAFSKSEHLKARGEQPHIYVPSADFSSRIALEDIDLLIGSAFADFLLSPLADDDRIERNLHNRMELGPDSLWRAHLFTTTIGPGETRLRIGKDKDAAHR